MTRTYNLFAVTKHSQVKLNKSPMTHEKACKFKSCFTEYKFRTLELRETQ